DEDGLGAMLAFANYLDAIGKKYTAYVIGTPPSRLSFLPRFDRLSSVSPAQADALVAFDYGNFARLKLDAIGAKPSFIATLDHHPQDTQKGDVNITDTAFSSTCEIACHFFKTNGITITKGAATCIYTGMVADTGGFIHSNTSSEVFRIAAELKELGADTELIAKRVLGFASVGAAAAIGLAFSRLTVDKDTHIMYTWLSSRDLEEKHTEFDDIGMLVSMMNHIRATNERVRCVALFKDKNDGMISVSFRSDSEKRFDAGKLVGALGGGGHQYAAATKMKGTLKEAIAKVLQEAKRKNYTATW
ncbi:DHH family phosphoesterase, partial [Candidatus Azambacteria bacterium]|nr:DHH family phosphoesterase [Candidatus Azambacteria bacterium]